MIINIYSLCMDTMVMAAAVNLIVSIDLGRGFGAYLIDWKIISGESSSSSGFLRSLFENQKYLHLN
jgi:hypothetical protein